VTVVVAAAMAVVVVWWRCSVVAERKAHRAGGLDTAPSAILRALSVAGSS